MKSIMNALVPAAALVVLTACGSAPPAPAGTVAPTSATTTATPDPAGAPDASPIARCTAADLTLRLGAPAGEGQRTVPLIYTNSSDAPCEIRGVPGVDLVGPPDPNGEAYQVPRPVADENGAAETLEPGATATATLTYLTDSPGSVGTLGSTGWVPAQVVSTPPGDTEQLTASWESGDTVLRQDGATRPGTFVGPLAVD